MKLVPFGKDPAVLRLAVVTFDGDGMPYVAAVDQDGTPLERGMLLEITPLERGMLLKITPEGYDPCEGVDPKLGLPLDKSGRFVRADDAGDAEALSATLKEVKHWITNDSRYRSDMSLNECSDMSLNECSASDRLHVTVGQLRIIVNALEKRL